MSSFKITYGDITAIPADAVVNSANRAPVCGGSTEAKIYERAGYENLLRERQKIGHLAVCDIAVTPAFRLDAKYLIFVSAPRYNEGRSGEEVALSICYRKILEKAVELGCRTLATPLLSSGNYRFPKDNALQVAKNSIEKFLAENPSKNLDVQLVLYDFESQSVSQQLFGIIEDYIQIHYEFSPISFESESEAPKYGICAATDQNLSDILNEAKEEDTFRDRMNELMRLRNISAPTLQRNADIDRRLFSKINGKKTYHVSKNTALAIAIGLQLDYAEACDLIARAGYALSPSSRADLIARYFLENKEKFFREDANKNQYKVPVLNDILMEHGEEVLGYGRNL